MENIQFSLRKPLPDNHIVNQEYNAFLDKFGRGNLIVVGVKDDAFHAESICLVE
jgi:hypothetical protein